MERIKSGFINGIEYVGQVAPIGGGVGYMASIIPTETAGFGGHETKVCPNKDEAIDAIHDLWAALEEKLGK